MRILHLASTLAAGGIASSLGYMLPCLSSLPHVHVEMVTLYGRGQFGDLLARARIPIHELHLGRKYAPQALPRLMSLLHRGRYDVVHAHGWPGLLFVALASMRSRGSRYVLSEHNVTNRRRHRSWLRPLDRWVYSRYDRVVAVSDRVADALVAWLPETAGKVRVVHNGVEPAALDPSPRARTALGIPLDVPLLLFVGGLHRRKGLDVLLDALAHLTPESWSTKPALLVCGEGPLQHTLRARAVDLGLSGRIHFLGYRQDVPALMMAADLFVLPSRWEGCPMVVLEAMASGLPIVATAVGGVPELIEDGVHGRLVTPADPAALAAAIHGALAHPDLTARMASEAQKRVIAEFAAEVAAGSLFAQYQEILGSPLPAPAGV
jgi:glycosyltransferase involved in cell wall biosynthesis